MPVLWAFSGSQGRKKAVARALPSLVGLEGRPKGQLDKGDEGKAVGGRIPAALLSARMRRPFCVACDQDQDGPDLAEALYQRTKSTHLRIIECDDRAAYSFIR